MENKVYSTSFKIRFIKHYIKSDVVYYKALIYAKNDDSFKVYFDSRYSELEKLHDIFYKAANSESFPEFPPKKFFGNKDEIFLNKRLLYFQAYFSNILNSREFSQLDSVKDWIFGLFNSAKTEETQMSTNNDF